MAKNSPVRKSASPRRRLAATPPGGGARSGRAQKSAARREAILAAALDEFSQQGFAAARLDDVARRAGVAKGTIYLHFKDKQALFQELVRTMISPVAGALEQAPLLNLPLRAVAERLIDMFVRDVYGSRRKDLIRLIIAEGPRFPELAEFYYREVLERILTALRGIARHAVETGELRDDALVRYPQLLAASGILAIVWSGLFERLAPLDVEAMMRAHLSLILDEGRAR